MAHGLHLLKAVRGKARCLARVAQPVLTLLTSTSTVGMVVSALRGGADGVGRGEVQWQEDYSHHRNGALDGVDGLCGAVVSLRSKVDRIQLWTRSKDDVEKLNAIGKKLVKLLDVSEQDGIGLEFQVSFHFPYF